MPNIDLLLDNIVQVVKSDKSQQTLLSTLDLRYTYSQITSDTNKLENKEILKFYPNRRQRHRDIPISDRILRSHSHVGRIPEGYWPNPHVLYKYIRLYGRHIDNNERITQATLIKTANSSEKLRRRKSRNISGQVWVCMQKNWMVSLHHQQWGKENRGYWINYHHQKLSKRWKASWALKVINT